MAITFFRKKSVHAIRAAHEAHVRGEGDQGPALKRALGFWSLTALGIGCTIGSGIFVMPAEIGSQTGPAMVISFVIAAIASALAALSYVELACLIPASGSAYSYSYVALGEGVAWLIGWALLLEYGLANSAVAAGWGDYLNQILTSFGFPIPPVLLYSPGQPIPGTHAVGFFNLPAAISIALVTIVLVMGIKESARTNNVLVALKCTVLLVFLGFCAPHFDPKLMTPFMPNGWHSVEAGAASLFFLFIGFDAVSTVAEEAKDAQRDMPRGILAALGIVTALYVAVGLVLTGLYSVAGLKGLKEPLAKGLELTGHPMAAWVLSLVAVVGILSVLLVGSVGQTRILYIMSRDGLMPRFMARVSPRTGTPVESTLILGLVTAIIGGMIPLGDLADLVSAGTLAAFCAVSLGVIVMRHREPDLPRLYRCPWVPVLPAAGILINLYLMTTLSNKVLVVFGLWMLAGAAIYFLWGQRSASEVFERNEAMPLPLMADRH